MCMSLEEDGCGSVACSPMACTIFARLGRVLAALLAGAALAAVLGCGAGSSDDRGAAVEQGESLSGPQSAGEPSVEDAGAGTDGGSDGGGDGDARQPEEQSPGEGDSTPLPDEVPADASAATAEPGGSIRSTPREDVPSALRDRGHPDHPEPLIDLSEIRSGGPPPDGIPPLEDPAFEPAGEVDWLAEVEPVLALEINGDARAYPLRIMTWHELVNGTVGGVPVTVSYCPLCNSAVAYDRRVGDRILDFGTSGELFNSSLVMYDRQTESLWSHYTGTAVAGHLTGIELDLIPVQTVSFRSFLSTYPQGHVLSLDTGHSRSYGQNPYEFYDSSGRPFLFSGPFDERLEPLARVLALRADGEGAVIPLDVLAERRVVPFSFAGRELVALFEPGTASALDSRNIAEGRDVGATGVFVRSVEGRPLDLSASTGGGFVDATTGATYDILGRPAAQGAAALAPVEHLDTFWFATAAFYPEAEIIGQ